MSQEKTTFEARLDAHYKHLETHNPAARAHLSAHAATIAIAGATKLIAKYKKTGEGKIPADGRAIIAANHVSHIDPVLLGSFIYLNGRVPIIMAKDSLFKKGPAAWFLKSAHQIPVDRTPGQGGRAIAAAKRALNHDDCVLIFPEGTTTKQAGGWPGAAQIGAATLALETRSPLIPLAQFGPQNIFDAGKPKDERLSLYPRKTVTYGIGKPLNLHTYQEAYAHAGSSLERKDIAQDVTSLLMTSITAQLAAIRQEEPAGHYVPSA